MSHHCICPKYYIDIEIEINIDIDIDIDIEIDINIDIDNLKTGASTVNSVHACFRCWHMQKY